MQFLIDSLFFLVEFVWDFFWFAVESVVVGFFAVMVEFACSLVELLPFETLDSLNGSVVVDSRIAGVLNVYVPIADILAVFGLVYSFLAVVYLIRFIIKLIPTVG